MRTHYLNREVLDSFLATKGLREHRFLRSMGVKDISQLAREDGWVPTTFRYRFQALYGPVPNLFITQRGLKAAKKIVASEIDEYKDAGQHFKNIMEDYYHACKVEGLEAATLTSLFSSYQESRCKKGELLARDKMRHLARVHGVSVNYLIGLDDGGDEIGIPYLFEEQGVGLLSRMGLVSKQFYPIIEGSRFPGWNLLLKICREFNLCVDYVLSDHYGEEEILFHPTNPIGEVL